MAITNFNLYGFTHILSMIIPLIIGFIIIFIGYKTKQKKHQTILRYILIILLLLVRGTRYGMDVYYGVFEWADLISLQVCHIDLILLIICLIVPNKYLFSFNFLVGIPMGLAVALFPGRNHPAPGILRAILFIMSHMMLVVCALYLAFVEKMVTTLKIYITYVISFLVCIILIYFINLQFKTNFLYIMYAPKGTVIEKLANLFGYPGYVYFMFFLTVILMFLMYILNYLINKFIIKMPINK